MVMKHLDDRAHKVSDNAWNSVLNDIHRVSIKKSQKLLRYRNQTTTEIYLKKIDDDLAMGLRLLEKKETHWDTQIKMGVI